MKKNHLIKFQNISCDWEGSITITEGKTGSGKKMGTNRSSITCDNERFE